MSRKRIGELLVERGAISKEQLDAGLLGQKRTRQRLGLTLIQQGVISEVQLAIVLAQSLELGSVDLAKAQVDWSAVHMLRPRFCENHEVFPFGIEGKGTANKKLLLAMADPLNQSALDEVEFTTGLKPSVRVATYSHIREAILRYYHKVSGAEAQAAVAAMPKKVQQAQSGAPPPAAQPAPVAQKLGTGAAKVKLVPSDVQEEGSDSFIIGEEIRSGLTKLPQDPGLETLIAERQAQSKQARKDKKSGVTEDLEFLFGANGDAVAVETLEKKFWVLMRIMARKGLITREEFLKELEDES